MSQGTFSPFTVDYTLNMIRENCWIGLHFDDPSIAGAYASEIAGSGYVRLQATFSEISGRAMWLAIALKWTGLPQTTITHIAGWNQQFNGDYLFSDDLTTPRRINEGKGYQIGENELAVSM